MSKTLSVCPKCHSLNSVSREKAKTRAPTCGKCGAELALHGLVSEVMESDFSRILDKSEDLVVVDFWAPWCGPCKSYGPHFEKASLQNDQAVFVKVNVDEAQHLSSSLGIRGVPCTILFKNGREIKRQSGAMSVAQLNSFLST